MDTLSAFAMGRANRGRPMMVFDWNKAALLIRERRPSVARAGLRSDWEYTGGDIYRDGAPVPAAYTYVYLASTWAVPELDLDGDVVDCFLMEPDASGWGARTYWPDSAVAMLAAKSEGAAS